MKTQEQIDREHEQRERMDAIHDAAEALLNRELTRNHFGDYNAVDRWEVARFGEKGDIVLVVIDCENWVNDGPLYELALQSLDFLEGAEGCDEEWTSLMSGSAQDITCLVGDGCIMLPDEMVDRIEAEVKALCAMRLSSELSRIEGDLRELSMGLWVSTVDDPETATVEGEEAGMTPERRERLKIMDRLDGVADQVESIINAMRAG